MNGKFRTDLALELNRMHNADLSLPGVTQTEQQRNGTRITRISIGSEQAASVLCKPVGTYVTLELGAFLRREENAFENTAHVLADELRGMAQLSPDGGVLVVGLGNRAITPDAVGPETSDRIIVTRHLRAACPQEFGSFREVSALACGVLGTTGIESAQAVCAFAQLVQPECIIAVDALAAAEPERLCRTIQISDSGISPGSGVGNRRDVLDRASLGIPVIAVGVPTVIDAETLVRTSVPDGAEPSPGCSGMIVTPKDIDANVRDVSRLIAYGINMALHDGLTAADIDMLIG